MPEVFSRFDGANYLKTDADIAAYLEASAEEGDPAAIAAALGTVARARNVSQIARDIGMTREGISKALSPEGNPAFATVVKVARAIGFDITFRLHDERADTAGHQNTDTLAAASANSTNNTVEAIESGDQAVAGSQARVRQEVTIRKEASDRVETVRDTVRREDVEITRMLPEDRISTRQ